MKVACENEKKLDMAEGGKLKKRKEKSFVTKKKFCRI